MSGENALAVLAGGMLGLRTYLVDANEDTRRARRRADSASDKADDALDQIDQIRTSYDLRRVSQDRVQDFCAGLLFPGKIPPAVPSESPSAPLVLLRPDLSEAIAVGPEGWPAAANEYTDDGRFVRPESPFIGQNFGTGLALGRAETAAFVMGLGQSQHPAAVVLAQHYRAAKGLSNALAALGSAPLSQAQMDVAFARLFGGGAAASFGYYWEGPTAPASPGAAVASKFYDIPWAAGELSVGQGIKIVVDMSVIFDTHSPTLSLRGPSGLVTIGAATLRHLGATTTKTMRVEFEIRRIADNALTPVYRIATKIACDEFPEAGYTFNEASITELSSSGNLGVWQVWSGAGTQSVQVLGSYKARF